MNDNHPLPYTLAGRMLLFLSLILPVAGTWLSIYISQEILAFERMPLTAIATPNVVMGFGLFVTGAAMLRRFGVRVRKDDVVRADGRVLRKPARLSPPSASVAISSNAFCTNCGKESQFDEDDRCLKCNWFR